MNTFNVMKNVYNETINTPSEKFVMALEGNMGPPNNEKRLKAMLTNGSQIKKEAKKLCITSFLTKT